MKKLNFLPMLVIVLVIGACKKPKAGFSADKTVVYVGQAIHFFDNDAIRKNCTFTYDFGDGTNSSNNNSNIYGGGTGYGSGNNSNTIYSDRNPSHIYWQPGTYEVSQTIAQAGNLEKGKSKQASASLTITIKPIVSDFILSDTSCTTATVVHLTNTTIGGDYSLWASSGYGWTYANITNPGLSGNVTVTYVGGNGTSSYSTEAYITFNSPGTWKITLATGSALYLSSKTKIIVVS